VLPHHYRRPIVLGQVITLATPPVQIQRLQDGVAPQPRQLTVDGGLQLAGAGNLPTDGEAVRDGVEEWLGGVQVARAPRRHELGRRRVDDQREPAVAPDAVETFRQTGDDRGRPERLEASPGGAQQRVGGCGQLVVGDATPQHSELVVGRLYQLHGAR